MQGKINIVYLVFAALWCAISLLCDHPLVVTAQQQQQQQYTSSSTGGGQTLQKNVPNKKQNYELGGGGSGVPYQRSYFAIGQKAIDFHQNSGSIDAVRNEPNVPNIAPLPLATQTLSTSEPSAKNYQNENESEGEGEGEASGAYSWGYRWIDEFGTQMFREETSDGRGTVRGRYSYRQADGIIRIVEYVSDAYGYRTRIRSNEPGLVSSNPAGAEIIKFDDENNIPLR